VRPLTAIDIRADNAHPDSYGFGLDLARWTLPAACGFADQALWSARAVKPNPDQSDQSAFIDSRYARSATIDSRARISSAARAENRSTHRGLVGLTPDFDKLSRVAPPSTFLIIRATHALPERARPALDPRRALSDDDVMTDVQTDAKPDVQPLAVGVVGCGRMGQLHARVYSQMPQVHLVGLYDADPDIAAAASEKYGGEVFTEVEALAERVQAVTIAAPTRYHAAIAEPLLRRGVACLIEKPLAKDVGEAKQIVEWAKASGAVVQVGHIERFNPIVRSMSKLAVEPRFIEVIRISPLTFRSIDVGVVLDVMIHDIDIVLRLARSKVAKIDAVGVSVIGGPEDICNARLTFENGCVANMTASRLALKTERKLRVFTPEAYVSIDYQKKYGMVARKTENLSAIRDAVAQIRAGEIDDISQLDFTELVSIEELQIDDIEPLRAELESFVNAVQTGAEPEVPAEDGLAAVEIATRIVEAIGSQKLE
jgi:predicted dehydrogenase